MALSAGSLCEYVPKTQNPKPKNQKSNAVETATSPEKSSIAATSAQTFTLRLLTLDDIDAAYDLLAHEDSAAASMWTPEQGKFYLRHFVRLPALECAPQVALQVSTAKELPSLSTAEGDSPYRGGGLAELLPFFGMVACDDRGQMVALFLGQVTPFSTGMGVTFLVWKLLLPPREKAAVRTLLQGMERLLAERGIKSILCSGDAAQAGFMLEHGFELMQQLAFCKFLA